MNLKGDNVNFVLRISSLYQDEGFKREKKETWEDVRK